MRVATLVVFVLVGVLVGWLTRSLGMSALAGYGLAVACALVVAWIVERYLLPRRRRTGV
ncbi:MAG TPA: hypothetical protein VJ717_05105 [Gemmatimonadaceae bacterium]|nr:hypothetical protein [Gemmatimonadaceae bacterium]